MTYNLKSLTKKQKIIICISTFVVAVVLAVAATFLVIPEVEESPAVMINTTQNTPIPDADEITTPDYVYRPEASIVVTEDGVKEKVGVILDAANSVKPTEKNKIIVKNHKVDSSKLIKLRTKISLEFVSQDYGSEISALVTVLKYYGYDVTQSEISDEHLDKTGNKLGDFREVYVGNPDGDGFGCYAKPIVNAANRYLESANNAYTAVDYSGARFEALLKLLESDTPVIIWGTTYNEESKTLNEPYATIKWKTNDEEITWISPEHCMVLIGYDLETNVAIISDPMHGIVEYDLDTVKARYLALQSQCVALERKPIITGIENGTVYYTTQCVTVSEHNIASITLNGIEVDNAFLLTGNIEDTYQIEVIEKNGNIIKYVVYTKPISTLYDLLGEINEFTATENDRENITSVMEIISTMETGYSPYEETQQLENIMSACELMLGNIEAAAERIESIKETFQSYENQSLSESDIVNLTRFSEEVLAFNSNSNLTNEQKNELIDIHIKCNELLDAIQITE